MPATRADPVLGSKVRGNPSSTDKKSRPSSGPDVLPNIRTAGRSDRTLQRSQTKPTAVDLIPSAAAASLAERDSPQPEQIEKVARLQERPSVLFDEVGRGRNLAGGGHPNRRFTRSASAQSSAFRRWFTT